MDFALDKTLIYWLRLSFVPNLGIQTVKRLLQLFLSLEAVFLANSSLLEKAGLTSAQIAELSAPNSRLIDEALQWEAASERHHLVPFGSAPYPLRLAQITHPPLMLYVCGDLQVLKKPQLAMVGTRNPTHTGREYGIRFAQSLVEAGLVITSGLALGIDGVCHQAAVEAAGETIAVLGSGLQFIYPRRHIKLAKLVSTAGCLVSEYPLFCAPKKHHFPRRNRIISGLSLGVLVVEAARQSGSLITAKMAMDEGREVFALPGSLQNPLSTGCHWLIQQGAKLVTGVEDIYNEINLLYDPPPQGLESRAQDDLVKKETVSLDSHEKLVLACIDNELTTIDQICERSKLSAQNVLSAVAAMQLAGHIQSEMGGYIRTD